MRYTHFVLTVIAISILLLIAVVWQKPIPNRYIFRNPAQQEWLAVKCEILDTATGKIYLWTEMGEAPDGKQGGGTIEIADPIRNTLIRESGTLRYKIKIK